MFVAIQLIIQMCTSLLRFGSIWHFKFPKVVQAHTLGEVGILDAILLRVYSGMFLQIFIKIGSYLTDKEQKISWHSFFETRCISWTSFTVEAYGIQNHTCTESALLDFLVQKVSHYFIVITAYNSDLLS